MSMINRERLLEKLGGLIVGVDENLDGLLSVRETIKMIRLMPDEAAADEPYLAQNEVVRTILKKAINHYGIGPQRDKAIEELSELIRALARCDDRKNIAEEMADVRIMLAQLEIIFGNRDQVRQIEREKLKRLSDRLHAADTVG